MNSQQAHRFTALSFNVWSDAPANVSWTRRRDAIASVLSRHRPDFAGLQEATFPMLGDLQERLPDYRWIGVGRDDGAERGEYTPIFYRHDRWEPGRHGNFWLSAKCDLPGRGWDALCSRVVTWGEFSQRSGPGKLAHFNTHLDHFGRKARREGAALLQARMIEIARDRPVILTGDFNCGESSAAYRLLTGQPPFETQPDALRLRDAFRDTRTPHEGPVKSYRGLLSLFGIGRIDFIFAAGDLRTERHAILDEARGASDHRPVFAEFSFMEGGAP